MVDYYGNLFGGIIAVDSHRGTFHPPEVVVYQNEALFDLLEVKAKHVVTVETVVPIARAYKEAESYHTTHYPNPEFPVHDVPPVVKRYW